MENTLNYNPNINHFESLEDLNEFAKGKYQKNANHFVCSRDIGSGRIFSVNFNNINDITLSKLMYIGIEDFYTRPDDKIAFIGTLNSKKDLNSITGHIDGKHIMIVSDRYIKTIELAIIVFNVREDQDYMDIIMSMDVFPASNLSN